MLKHNKTIATTGFFLLHFLNVQKSRQSCGAKLRLICVLEEWKQTGEKARKFSRVKVMQMEQRATAWTESSLRREYE